MRLKSQTGLQLWRT